MNDLLTLFIAFWVVFSLFFAGWFIVEIADNSRKINWKTFPFYFLIAAPGFIFIGSILVITYPIFWILENAPKKFGPFK